MQSHLKKQTNKKLIGNYKSENNKHKQLFMFKTNKQLNLSNLFVEIIIYLNVFSLVRNTIPSIL